MASEFKLNGVIKRVHATFGFIEGEDGTERFFIPSSLQKTTCKFEDLAVGQKVQFVPIVHPKGPRAIEIRVL